MLAKHREHGNTDVDPDNFGYTCSVAFPVSAYPHKFWEELPTVERRNERNFGRCLAQTVSTRLLGDRNKHRVDAAI